MGLFSKVIAENMTGLKIDDGILVKCKIKEGVVTIPDNVNGVKSDAFDGCEKVRINRSPEYIKQNLENVLIMAMEDLKDENENPEYSDSKYYPICRVFELEGQFVEAVMEDIIAKDKVKGFREFIAIDAAELNKEGLEVKTSKIRTLISDAGYKILFLKNLTPESAEALPRNFIYNLVKSQSFNYLDLGPKCLIVLGVSNETRLDEPKDVGSDFFIEYYTNLTPKAYLEEMRLEGKVIDAEVEKDNAMEEAESVTLEPDKIGGKEIDWEERHFQICLALISRADLTSYHNSTVASREIHPVKIIKTADKMVEALKQHLKDQGATTEN